MRGANNQPQIHSKPLDCLTAHSSRCTLPCLFAEWARCLIHGPLFFCPALLSAFTAKMAARGLMRTDVFLLCLPGWRRLRSSPAKFNGACPTTTGFLCVNANPMAAQFCEHPQILKCIMDAEPYLPDSINVHVFGEPGGELRIADQKLFSAVGLWAPDAIRAREGQRAVERILAAMGLIPFERAWEAQSPSKPLVMAIRSCGPGGFGSIARRATLDAAALQAWEAARGREPGEGAQAFARLVELACRRKSWRPELAWSEPASKASLSLSPLGDSSPPSALKAGKPSLEREVEEAGKSMGLRVSFGKS